MRVLHVDPTPQAVGGARHADDPSTGRYDRCQEAGEEEVAELVDAELHLDASSVVASATPISPALLQDVDARVAFGDHGRRPPGGRQRGDVEPHDVELRVRRLAADPPTPAAIFLGFRAANTTVAPLSPLVPVPSPDRAQRWRR
jgi:hypothetical protein